VKKYHWIIILFAASFSVTGPLSAADDDTSNLQWEKGYINLGYYFATTDSSVRLGEGNLGLGVSLDLEDFLGVDTTEKSFRIDAGWRFSENLRHKVTFGWYGIRRDGSKTINETIDIPPELGGGQIGPGQFETTFDFDIYQIKYEYSFFLDERVDLNAGIGLFIMPIEFSTSVSAGGVGSGTLKEDITAPLPVFGLGFDVMLTPKWFIRQQTDIFYLEIDNYEGGILSVQLALEYLPWKNFGFGISADSLNVNVEARNSDVPGVDFNGKIEFHTLGAQVYLKAYF
jgi:hypothetical protein